MAFDNHYPNRKDRRQPYRRRGSRVCRSCRPHGSCPYCRNNRLHRHERRAPAGTLDEWLEDWDGGLWDQGEPDGPRLFCLPLCGRPDCLGCDVCLWYID